MSATTLHQAQDFYRRFAASAAGLHLPVFFQPWWLDLVCADWEVAVVQKGDLVAGVWPYARERKGWVQLMRTPPMTPYLGPHVFFPADLKAVNRDRYEHEVLSELIKLVPDPKVWNLAVQPGIRQAGLFRTIGLTSVARQTFLLDIQQEESLLRKGFKESLRRNLNTAAADFELNAEPAALSDLLRFRKAMLEEKNLPVHAEAELAGRLLEACVQHQAGTLWTARKAGMVHAAVWQVWDANRSYYLMGGTDPQSGDYRALSVLLWHAICHARSLGQSVFDFEGSMDPGVDRFFRNFGGQRELYLTLRKNASLTWRLVNLIRRR